MARSLVLCFDVDCDAGLEFHGEVTLEDGDLLDELFDQSLTKLCDVDDDDGYVDSSNSRDYPDERSSPREHDVSGYDRQQNGKTVHVNPYKRGGRHDDD